VLTAIVGEIDTVRRGADEGPTQMTEKGKEAFKAAIPQVL